MLFFCPSEEPQDLGIHSSSYRKCVSRAGGTPFLNSFIILNKLIADALPSNLTESEVRELLVETRKVNLDIRATAMGPKGS